ncbi:serine hydrolase [uncultured Algibacter sp.]|uniref:serine hydrolase domain-containing protein n=1 Tax=uncultured Algibacter sp. TaxID=298659 RepID=UPI002627701D|nr:serine hydrolase domain-containing protein [uncultured Algibacter sp.]
MKYIFIILSTILCFSCQERKDKPSDLEIDRTNNPNNIILDKKLDSLYNLKIFNGFSATIVDSTGILYNKGFGYANVEEKKKYTANTIINIASVSKVFIGMALLKAQEMNLVNLDDPINMHLPFKVINPNYPEDVITIRHLATHTSTIVDTDIYLETCYINKNNIPISENLMEKYGTYYQNPSSNWIPLKEYLSKVLKGSGEFYTESTFANRKSGEIYEYSNIGAALCGLVIESAAKKPFSNFTKEHIFKPLKMHSTGWFFEDVDSSNYSKLYADNHKLPYYRILSYPDGGLITSSTDLSSFLVELIKGHYGNGTILNANSYKELFKPQLQEKAFQEKENKNEGYNTGLFLDLEPAYNVIGHTGGDPGINSFMFFDTKTGRGRILITNTDSQKENSGAVFYEIWNSIE